MNEDDFSEHPETLGEKRSDKDGNAAKWSPRDALISALRDIDSRTIKPDAMVICWREKKGDGETVTSYRNCGPDVHTSLGLLTVVQMRLVSDG